jgi:hypothetical protein
MLAPWLLRLLHWRCVGRIHLPQPRVDASIAEQLIAARPFPDKAAFVAKLSELVSAEQAAVGGAYVEG